MHLKIIVFFFFVFISLNYVIDDVVGIARKDHRPTVSNQNHSRPKTPAGNKVKRILNELFKEFVKENAQKYPHRPYKYYFFQHTPPIVNILPTYIFLDATFYGTEYDTENKLPVYSAYKLYSRKTYGRISPWYKFPNLVDFVQPIIRTGLKKALLHRGHLYPQLYAVGKKMKKSTNYLTNSALQYAAFNMNTWKRLEYALYKASVQNCQSIAGAEVFFLTGVIPSRNNFFYQSNVNIPDYFWTAVCCDTSHAFDQNKKLNGWSFAYSVKNENKTSNYIEMYFVEDFIQLWHGRFLQFFEPYNVNVNRYVKECLFDPDKAINVITDIKIWNARRDIFHMNGRLLTHFNNRP